jgi:hypothetical protein
MRRVWLVLVLLLWNPGLLSAQPLTGGGAASPTTGVDPWFAGDRLFGEAQDGLWGLAATEHAGLVAYDPGSGAFFASAAGALVEVRRDGALLVVDPELDARDLDVRRAVGLVVFRGPGGIVLRHLGQPQRDRILLAGEDLFEPRFDREGSQVLVSESGSAGGHFRVLSVADGRDLARVEGGGPAWAGPGTVVFHRAQNDGHRITTSDLWLLDLATGAQRRLTHTEDLAETQPAASPDGRWLVFVDAFTGKLHWLPRNPKEATHEGH